MAMTKAEKAELERLRADLALARAMRWPDYPRNAPMTAADIAANLVEGGMKYGSPQKVARGWFYSAYLDNYRSASVTYGCSDGITHSIQGDKTTSQRMGVMYRTKREALQNLRLDLTEQCAKILAEVDRQLAECDD